MVGLLTKFRGRAAAGLFTLFVLGFGASHLHAQSSYWPKHDAGPISWPTVAAYVVVIGLVADLAAMLFGSVAGIVDRLGSQKPFAMFNLVYWVSFYVLLGLALWIIPGLF